MVFTPGCIAEMSEVRSETGLEGVYPDVPARVPDDSEPDRGASDQLRPNSVIGT